MSYIAVIGLEIHAELLTKTKIFCRCENKFGGEMNTRVCPVCSGFPGALPVLNKEAVTLSVKAGLALDCKINNYSAFDRKNYFYPDLPKGYQITQYDYPIASDGYIKLDNKKIGIERIHIEEDAGKLIHEDNVSVIDYNRCGVPLIEIVTNPDFNSADEVCEFVEAVALRLKYAGVSDSRLEQGSLRVDVNISIMEENSAKLGTRAEIKNLNSLKSIRRAIEYEIKRQTKLLGGGKKVLQETRNFDEKTSATKALRIKENASEYRYFREPDLLPLYLTDDDIRGIKQEMNEGPEDRFLRYTNEYGLTAYDARLIICDKAFSDFYDQAVDKFCNYKETAKIMLGEVNRYLNENTITIEDVTFSPYDIARLVTMVQEKKITKEGAKYIVKILFREKITSDDAAEKYSLIIKEDIIGIKNTVKRVLADNENNVDKYKSGNEKLFGYFMGQAMRAVGKGVNPETVRKILMSELK